MGNHVNVNGVAVFELTVGKDGHIVSAKALSGHPLALPTLDRGYGQMAVQALRTK